MLMTQYSTPINSTFASLALKLPICSSTRAPARLLAVSAFGHLAPGIKPTQKEIGCMLKLIWDMTQSLHTLGLNREYLVSYRLHPEYQDELDVIQFYVPETGVVLADAWIEFPHTPQAFFYWES